MSLSENNQFAVCEAVLMQVSKNPSGWRVALALKGGRTLRIWKGHGTVFDQPAYRDTSEHSAVVIQQGKGGQIIAAIWP